MVSVFFFIAHTKWKMEILVAAKLSLWTFGHILNQMCIDCIRNDLERIIAIFVKWNSTGGGCQGPASTDQNDHRSFSSFAVCRIVNIKLIGAAYSHRSQKRWRKRLVKCISCLRRFSNARRCRSLHDMQWSEMAHTALHQRSTRLNAMPMQVAGMDYEISRGTSGWCFILFVVFADRLSAKCSRRVGLPKMIAEELAKMRDVAFCMAKTQHHFSLEKTAILSSHRLDMRTSLFLCRSKSIEETSAWYLIDGSRFTKKKKNVCVLAISHLYMSQHSSTFPTDRARALKFPHRCPAS